MFFSLLAIAECPESSRSCKEARSERASRTEHPTTHSDEVIILGTHNKGNRNRVIIDGDTILKNRGNLEESENRVGLIVIKSGYKTREIILNNIDIDARNLYSSSHKNKALIVVDAEKGTKITANNIRINAKKVNLKTHKNSEENSFSGLIHLQAKDSNIDTSNIHLHVDNSQLESIK